MMQADGNVDGTENVIDPQGIDQDASKLVPLLVKTILQDIPRSSYNCIGSYC